MIKTILGFFPHPDDEIGAVGLFQRAINKGINVHIVCATRGEAGRIRNRKCHKTGELIDIRTNEIKDCCHKLGVSSLSFLELKDNKAETWIGENAQGKLGCLIEKINPDLVITFDKNGVNGHPDHKEIYKLTNKTINMFNRNIFLCYITVFPNTFISRKLFFFPLPAKLKNQLARKFSIKDEFVSFMLKLNRKELKLKLNLLKCHSSQFPDDSGKFFGVPFFLYKSFAKYECYYFDNPNIDVGKILLELSCSFTGVIKEHTR